MDDVVVWNVDARCRPELEVEIEILEDGIPGEHYARRCAELEVDVVADVDEDAWFLDVDAFLVSEPEHAALAL